MPVDPSLTPELIEARAFTTGFRGYDHSEVRDFLSRVATEVRAYRDRTERLESAWHSAEERAARPPVLDEDTLMAAVGDETATILRAARAAAADLRTRAATDAERIVAEAEAQAVQLRADSEGVMAREVAAAEEASARIVEGARSEAAEALEKARGEADAIRAAAQHEKALTVEGAIATRERVLEDLSRRRRVASVQIEQLRAGRERLLDSYAVVRRTLEEVNDELNRADAEARAAADEVGRRMQREVQPEPAPPQDAPAALDPEPEAVAPDAQPEPPVVTAEPVARASESPVPTVTPGVGRARGGVAAQAAATAAAEQPHEVAPEPEATAVPHLRVVTDVPGASGLGSKVDLLFARIRAGRSDRADREPHPGPTLVQAPGTEAPAGPDEAATPEPPAGAESLTGVEPPSGSEPPAGSESPFGAGPGRDAEDATGAGATRSDDDEALLQRRQAALTEVEAALTRKLKRALQDEQNDLLDRLRSLNGEPTAEQVLAEPADHVDRYAAAAQPFVEQAAAAGVSFVTGVLGIDRPASGGPAVSDLSEEAASTIVESLRRRLEAALSAAAGDEQNVLIEAVGAAYREWKSERIERIAGDVLAAAFARGTWASAPDGTPLHWVVDDANGPCPDCDDDVLAGSLPKGEAFPTGQLYPPAHPGCRCLLAPMTG